MLCIIIRLNKIIKFIFKIFFAKFIFCATYNAGRGQHSLTAGRLKANLLQSAGCNGIEKKKQSFKINYLFIGTRGNDNWGGEGGRGSSDCNSTPEDFVYARDTTFQVYYE